MIEKIEVQPITPDGCYGVNDLLIENKINELVDYTNSIEKSMKEHIVVQLDGEKVNKHKPHFDFDEDIEPTEQMYSLDEVAEMIAGVTDKMCLYVDYQTRNKDGWCEKGCPTNPTECWKHAIEMGWLEEGADETD